ncbi:hypothetical protein QEN19_002489 [Hanseniaspora menglaensis]
MSAQMLDARSIYNLIGETLKTHKYFGSSKNVNGVLLISKTGSLLMSRFSTQNNENLSVLNFISLLIASNYSQEEIVVEKLLDGNFIGIQSYEINLNLTNNAEVREGEEEDDISQQLYNMCCTNIPKSDLILVYLSKIDQLELGALKIIISKDVQLYGDLYGYKT